jgi:hypothetical protein
MATRQRFIVPDDTITETLQKHVQEHNLDLPSTRTSIKEKETSVASCALPEDMKQVKLSYFFSISSMTPWLSVCF